MAEDHAYLKRLKMIARILRNSNPLSEEERVAIFRLCDPFHWAYREKTGKIVRKEFRSEEEESDAA